MIWTTTFVGSIERIFVFTLLLGKNTTPFPFARVAAVSAVIKRKFWGFTSVPTAIRVVSNSTFPSVSS